MKSTDVQDNGGRVSALSGLIAAAGVILAISYPVLALSTGVRAVYQMVERDPTNSPWLTLLGALCYTVATVGFAKQPRPAVPGQRPPRRQGPAWWRRITPQAAWKVSMGVLVFESFMTLLVGTLSYVAPDVFGRNVWQFFGRDYGYFPLVQPLLGLAWLIHPLTLRAYGLRR